MRLSCNLLIHQPRLGRQQLVHQHRLVRLVHQHRLVRHHRLVRGLRRSFRTKKRINYNQHYESDEEFIYDHEDSGNKLFFVSVLQNICPGSIDFSVRRF